MPSWKIITVIDEEDTGRDYAYTVGLSRLGNYPELHLWAKPTDGHDLGVDFSLGPHDIVSLLNDTATKLIAEEITWDESFDVPLDGGFTTMRITLKAPQEAEAYDAWKVEEGSLVAGLSWELIRCEIGENAPLSLDALAHLWARAQQLGLTNVNSDVDQAYGPRTAVVEAVAEELKQLDSDGFGDLLRVATIQPGLFQAYSILQAAARKAGREQCMEATMHLADEIVELIIDNMKDEGEWADEEETDEFFEVTGEIAAGAVQGLLGAEVVADYLSVEQWWEAGGVAEVAIHADAARTRAVDSFKNTLSWAIAKKSTPDDVLDLAALYEYSHDEVPGLVETAEAIAAVVLGARLDGLGEALGLSGDEDDVRQAGLVVGAVMVAETCADKLAPATVEDLEELWP